MATNKIYLSTGMSTGVGNWCNVADYEYAVIGIQNSTASNCTLKILGTIEDTPPTTTSASAGSTSLNIEFIGLQTVADTTSYIVGDTGVTSSGTADCRYYRIDTQGLNWIQPVITAATSTGGTDPMLTVTAKLYKE